jgi:hypothetical protein
MRGKAFINSDPVLYEIYVRSFADSNGDGIGDLKGITARSGLSLHPWRPGNLAHTDLQVPAGGLRL